MNYLVLATSVQDIKDEIGEAIQNGGDYDYIQLIQQTSDVSRVLSVVYGVLVTVILILVPIIVSLELMYICFPLLRVHMESFVVKVESKGIAGKVVGFTLRDAREAVYKADTDSIGKHPLAIYLKLKCASMMMVMFVIAIVLTGMDSFIGFVKSLVDSIITQIFY